ncbi:MAG: hypothetical protein EOS85_15845 [Mesorhizobium sp.]|nr:MAG: hypothetical protein EOS85_15845 [Mesorhizobium sp.]
MAKRILGLIGIGLSILVIYGVKSAFNVSDQALSLAILAVLLLVLAFQFSQRLDAVEERVVHKDFDGIKKEIEDGERHPPEHKQPNALAEGGVKTYVTRADEIVFDDFQWFGTMMNRDVADPWAIEEMEDTEIRDFGSEAPEYGRRYRVYYNACDMGTLQVRSDGFDVLNDERFAANRRAKALLELHNLRFVPYDDALSLVRAVVLHLGPFEDREKAWDTASAEATATLSGHLWETVRVADTVMTFDHRTSGPYELVRRTTDHWKKCDIDPFEKWGGDRPQRTA